MSIALQRQNDLRAEEYDDKRGDWVQRAVGSARLYGIDEETISVGLDEYEEGGVPASKWPSYLTPRDLQQIGLSRLFSSENRDFRVLDWQTTVAAYVKDVMLPDYYRGHSPDDIVVSTELVGPWDDDILSPEYAGQLEELADALTGELDSYYEYFSYQAEQPVRHIDEHGDEYSVLPEPHLLLETPENDIREAIQSALANDVDLRDLDQGLGGDEDDEDEDDYDYDGPYIYVSLDFKKELRLPGEGASRWRPFEISVETGSGN
jgi:hypothetical protein